MAETGDVSVIATVSVPNDAAATARKVDLGGVLANTEQINITIDPVGGTDPGVLERRPLTTQARATLFGTMATEAAVADMLDGVRLDFDVVMTFADGTFAVATMGNWSKVVRGVGRIRRVSTSGHVLRAGTPATITVLSATARGFTATASTGLAPNSQRRQYLEGLTGANAGLFQPIFAHDATDFATAADWQAGTPSGGDTFRIVECATRLTGLEGDIMRGDNIIEASLDDRLHIYEGIELVGDLSDDFDLEGIEIQFKNCRIEGLPIIQSGGTTFWEGGFIYDGAGAGAFGWPGWQVQAGGIVRPTSNQDACLFADFAFFALSLAQDGSGNIFETSYDDIVDFAFESTCIAVGKGLLLLQLDDVTISSTAPVKAAAIQHIVITNGQLVSDGPSLVQMTNFVLATSPNGTVGDMQIDGEEVAWTFVDSNIAAGDSISGLAGSVYKRIS